MTISAMACSATSGIIGALIPRDQYTDHRLRWSCGGTEASCSSSIQATRGSVLSKGRENSITTPPSSFRLSGFSKSVFIGRTPTLSRPVSSTSKRIGNGTVVCRAASTSSSSSSATTSLEGGFEEKAHHGVAVKMLQRIAALRALPALVLGLGVALSLRSEHALAIVANETLSRPQSKGLLASAWAGLAAGCLHTWTGPDHLAALAPLCIGRSRLQSAAVGALWGFGHDTGQIVFGLVFLLLKDKLHIELIRTWASRIVGLTLMTIGGLGIHESQIPVAVLAEEAGLENTGKAAEGVRMKNDSSNATTFATGVVYGLQPDALLVILPALALPSRLTGAAFLAMFLLGTVLAMGSYTLFLSSCSHALQKRIPGITKNLTLGSSLIAIALGVALIISEFLGVTLF